MLRIAPFKRMDASALVIVGIAIAAIAPMNARTTINSLIEKPASRRCNRVRPVWRFDIDLDCSNNDALTDLLFAVSATAKRSLVYADRHVCQWPELIRNRT